MTREYDYELIVVSYRSRGQLEQMLETIPEDLPLAIIDNARGVDRIDQLLVDRTNARYLDSGGDAGFAAAANLGARTSTYPYLIFANPDTKRDHAVCQALIDQLTSDRTVGSCVPGTVDDDGDRGFVGGWEPTLRRAAIEAVGAHHLFPRSGLFYRAQPGEVIELDWLAGESLTVARDRFLELGGWDERYFLYNEDMGFGRRVREAGYRQLVRADLEVTHLSSRSGAPSTFMLRHRGASMTAYLRDHNGAVRARLMQALIAVGTVGRLGKSILMLRRDRVVEYLAYLQGLLFGRGPLS